MWIVFGWEKVERPIGDVCSGYCYDCRRQTTWTVWNHSEWVTFSALRTLRFVNRSSLHCSTCSFRTALTRADLAEIEWRMQHRESIDGTPLHARLRARIEMGQLGSKTPQQLKFIRASMAAEREYRQRIAENLERDG
jgi:hypothetical protein